MACRSLITAKGFSAAGFVQSLFLAQPWTLIKPGEWNGPAWSLSAQVFGYAFFPVLARFLIWRRSAAVCRVSVFASLTVLMIQLIIFQHTQDSPTGTFGLIRMTFGFVAGMSMSRCCHLWHETTGLGAPVGLASLVHRRGTVRAGREHARRIRFRGIDLRPRLSAGTC
jgi:peptidoglycan/LPS O-acetylase OafA/YrhL